jgi:hypothetical protein
MYSLRGSRQRRPGTGLREDLPDRRDPFWYKKEMLEVAHERVEKLKKRGYPHAGVYNPQGWAVPT